MRSELGTERKLLKNYQDNNLQQIYIFPLYYKYFQKAQSRRDKFFNSAELDTIKKKVLWA
jgi:hypothetical protein